MKEKLETYIQTHDELKQICYDLCNKWHKYITELEPHFNIYNCVGSISYEYDNINELEFTYEYDEFKIGYSEYRCGESDDYYTYIKTDEILDESLIKLKIDNHHRQSIEKIEKEKIEKEKEKELRKSNEYKIYLELKKKYE